MMTKDMIASKIQMALPHAHIEVQGDDGVHFEAVIIAQEFEGLSPIARHRLVYAALGNSMRTAIHALSIQTIAPSEQT
jgi:acid stress-induced BolA-like protein IbaG/YrbA